MAGPLAGVRVVEIAGLGPVPYAGMLLAELGADVLRVDRPGGGNLLLPSHLDLLHRSRPCAAVDLKDPAGVDLVLRLVDRADVLVEGLRPGVTERLGIGPEACLSRNPRLVYGRMTGWGQDGPLATTAGHDINYASLTGALHAIGPAAKPAIPLNIVGDFAGGSLFLVVGVLSALLERAGSGKGQVVDAAMVDGASSLITMIHGLLAAGLWVDQRESNLLDGGAPYYDTYACSDGRHVAVGAIEPQFYAVLLDRLSLTEQAGAAGAQNDVSAWPAHRGLFARVLATRTRDEWADHFAGLDGCVTPVLSLTEASTHPHLAARRTYETYEGTVQPAPAPRFSRTPAAIASGPRGAGQDTVTSLAAWGIVTTEIEELLRRGVVRQLPDPS